MRSLPAFTLSASVFLWTTSWRTKSGRLTATICTARIAALTAPLLPTATVATVAVGKSGAVNAAILAVQIVAVSRPDLVRQLVVHKKTLADKVKAGNDRIQLEIEKKRARG